VTIVKIDFIKEFFISGGTSFSKLSSSSVGYVHFCVLLCILCVYLFS